MTLEERIDLAGAEIWTHLATDYTSREVAEAAIRAAFPELFANPPSLMLVRAVTLDEALAAVLERRDAQLTPEEIARINAAAGDSHLSTLKGEKGE
jgi:hypothetical protein